MQTATEYIHSLREALRRISSSSIYVTHRTDRNMVVQICLTRSEAGVVTCGIVIRQKNMPFDGVVKSVVGVGHIVLPDVRDAVIVAKYRHYRETWHTYEIKFSIGVGRRAYPTRSITSEQVVMYEHTFEDAETIVSFALTSNVWEGRFDILTIPVPVTRVRDVAGSYVCVEEKCSCTRLSMQIRRACSNH